MPPDVHLDPHRLRMHAGRLAEVVDALRPASEPDAVLVCLRAPVGAALFGELDRLLAALVRAGRELTEMSATLRAAAAEVEAVDRDVSGSITRVAADLP